MTAESENSILNKLLHALKVAKDLKVIIIVVALAAVGVAMVAYSWPDSETKVQFFLLREIGKGLVLAALVSFGTNALINRQSASLRRETEEQSKSEQESRHEDLRDGLQRLQDNLAGQTLRLAESIASLDALRTASITRLYPNRVAASADIGSELTRNTVRSIKLMGISLNDFLQPNGALHRPWKYLEDLMCTNSGIAREDEVILKILLIDPRSRGAMLRSRSENRGDADTERLPRDVQYAMDKLSRVLEVQSEMAAQHPDQKRIRLQVRLYRTDPILFLAWTDSTAFAHQYYFQTSHETAVDIPVSRFTALPDSADEITMHGELGAHFDWIWGNASIGLEERVRFHSYGVDRAVAQARVENMSYDADESKKRIVHLIKEPGNKRIWIKGVSLHSFFSLDNELYEALAEAHVNGSKDIRILLINPDSEQARIRSFREYLAVKGEASLDDYKEDLHRQQRLYSDTQKTFARIMDFPVRQAGAQGSFIAKTYCSAPEAFMFITDSAAIVEQYHYGKSVPDQPGQQTRKTLEGAVPLTEYLRRDPAEETGSPRKDPYRIYVDHFSFVFKHCSEQVANL